MDARQVALVQASFEKAAALGEKVAEIFYAELFAIDPALRRMFKGDMADNARSCWPRSRWSCDHFIHRRKSCDLHKISRSSMCAYGVKPEHYTLVGNALLRTLKKGLGAAYTPEVRDAWVEAFRTLAGIMKEAAYGSSESKVRRIA